MKSSNNWREKVGKKEESKKFSWRIMLHHEYVIFAEEASLLAKIYHWNFWGGKVNNYAVTLSQNKANGKSISIKILASDNYSYFVSFKNETNPNNINQKEYHEKIASNLDDALKYLHNFLLENEYEPEFFSDLIIVMGGAYDRYPLELHWEKERIMEEIEKEEFV